MIVSRRSRILRQSIILTLAATALLAPPSACSWADVPLTGRFVARDACPAFQSIRRGANPGSIQTEPGRSYPVLAKNKLEASHYLVEITGAAPERRWVSIDCGDLVDGTEPAGDTQAKMKPAEFVLAVSWQPAFCETQAGLRKSECRTQTPDRFDASHFALHGLWPQPGSNIYCSVPSDQIAASKEGKWQRLPNLELDPETRSELEQVMPGAASNLDRHEWIKHGTCFGGETAEVYFSRSIALLNELNASRPRDLFASKLGSQITNAAIRQAFDEAFGEGAGKRVRVSCKRDGSRELIVELTIGLAGRIDGQTSLAELIAASEPTDSGCPRGIVDPAGLQ
jgi:ribonuclease T2